ncbi:hypothetical protein C0J52_11258 [Blattella germanica]|nr:hypothetical protein C0J52_11258 [Blattella germanica]
MQSGNLKCKTTVLQLPAIVRENVGVTLGEYFLPRAAASKVAHHRSHLFNQPSQEELGGRVTHQGNRIN